MTCENSVRVSGTIHHPKGEREGQDKYGAYILFSVRQTVLGYDGVERPSFLPVRVFGPELKKWLEAKDEGAPVCLSGKLHSSPGSGEMFILAESLEDRQ